MGSRVEVRVVNLAGLVQGITLVTFPAASSIFTDPSEYDLSSTQYGAMFLPQVLTAITAALIEGRLANRTSAKRVLLTGLAANTISMALLVISSTFMNNQAVAYALILTATACLGVGFGLTVPVLNTYAATFQPDRPDRAVLVLNALLGLGTALAPVFVAVFVGLGFWWGLPVTAGVLLVALLIGCTLLPLQSPMSGATERAQGGRIPAQFWLFASFAMLYGVCETMNGNWSQLEMTSEYGASTSEAALALTAFWAMVTVGRVFFAAAARWLPSTTTYRLLPILLIATFLVTAWLANSTVWMGITIFGLAGLGCSALLPLTISLGQVALRSGATAGGIIAFYQVGYGIAAFGVGPLLDHGVNLSQIYGWTALAAIAMAVVAAVITRKNPPEGSGTSLPSHVNPQAAL